MLRANPCGDRATELAAQRHGDSVYIMADRIGDVGRLRFSSGIIFQRYIPSRSPILRLIQIEGAYRRTYLESTKSFCRESSIMLLNYDYVVDVK
jgi:hypothetical protein